MTRARTAPEHDGGAGAATVVRSFLEAEDSEGFGAVLADDVVVTDWMIPGEELRGRDAVLERLVAPIAESFPDASFEVHDVLVDRGRVAVRGEFRATFERDYFGVPAHGGRVRWPAHDIYEVRGGRIHRVWLGNDTLLVARQLGALPDDAGPW